jgi:LPXTG-motif cell wall-anchored protein
VNLWLIIGVAMIAFGWAVRWFRKKNEKDED